MGLQIGNKVQTKGKTRKGKREFSGRFPLFGFDTHRFSLPCSNIDEARFQYIIRYCDDPVCPIVFPPTVRDPIVFFFFFYSFFHTPTTCLADICVLGLSYTHNQQIQSRNFHTRIQATNGMSFDINWETIYTDDGLRSSLKDFLNEKLTSIDLPKYMKDLRIVEVNLGSKSPKLTIRDIDYPFAEFYNQKEPEDSGNADLSIGSDSENRNRSKSFTSAEQRRTHHPVIRPQSIKKTMSESNYPLQTSELRTSSPIGIHSTTDLFIPRPGSPYLPGLHNGVGISAFGAREGETTSQNGSLESSIEPNVSIDGIQGETSGFKSPQKAPGHVPAARHEDGDQIDKTAVSENQTDAQKRTDIPAKGKNDIQFTMDLEWNSNIYIEVTCSLMVNYPSPGFITLPVRLKISDLLIHSLAVLAYLNHRVFVSFLCDLDDDSDAGAAGATTTRRSVHSDGSADAFLSTDELGSDSGNRIDIIKNMKIEGELGDYMDITGNTDDGISRSVNSHSRKSTTGGINAGRTRSYTNEINHHHMYSSSLSEKERLALQNWGASMAANEGPSNVDGASNGSVLRNIGKIEKFLLSALRKVLVNELAWPSWIEIDMNEEDE